MQSVLVLGALTMSGIASRYFFRRQFLSQVQGRLHDAFTLLSHNLPEDIEESWCAAQAKGTAFRFTISLASGKVYCDSQPPDLDGRLPDREIFTALEREIAGHDFATQIAGNTIYGVYRVSTRGLVLRATAPLTHLSETLTLFDTSLGFFVLMTLTGLGIVAVFSARRLVFPMGRLLVKTQSVLSKQPDVMSREDLSRESFDEWAELESNIDDIHRDLVLKTQSLSREQVELETILAAISDAILAVDTEGNPMFFNSRFELLFAGDGIRKRNIKLWGIFRDPDILDAFTQALKDGKGAATKAIPIDQQGGLRRYFSLSVSPLRREEGGVYGAVGIFHDVTELKSAEQMRIDFVANVSHELRTPLTVIKGYADTLIVDLAKQGGPMLDFLNSIARNADRLMALMNDLLDLSAIESSDVLQKDPLSTEEVTQRSLGQLRDAFAAKGQLVATEFKAAHVTADPQRLEQVLTNLLTNANKYTPAGGKIAIRWTSDGADVVLGVSNNGPGIPLEHQARLFERFYRIDKARSREQGGTGLGLAIVKHIMQRHGGNVWVESNPPEPGATFYCRFPA